METELNIKEWIAEEHQRAELERLDTGWEGCGCRDCQEFYKTLDLSRYGNRVVRTGDMTMVLEDKAKLLAKFGMKWVGADQIFIVGEHGYGVKPDGGNLYMGTDRAITEALATGKPTDDATPEQQAEYERIYELMGKERQSDGRPTDREMASRRRAQGSNRPVDKRTRPVYRPRNRWSHN